MTALRIGYGKVHSWVKGYLEGLHGSSMKVVAWAILCILAAQVLTPGALARALPMESSGTGRSNLRRVERWRKGRALEVGRLSPLLVRGALALLPSGKPVIVALDTTRAGPWELFLAGIVFFRRVLP